jgi:hypothetical protein
MLLLPLLGCTPIWCLTMFQIDLFFFPSFFNCTL